MTPTAFLFLTKASIFTTIGPANLIEALLPLAAARLKLDPAVVTGPALTTLVDITGLLIFFSTAKWLLGI